MKTDKLEKIIDKRIKKVTESKTFKTIGKVSTIFTLGIPLINLIYGMFKPNNSIINLKETLIYQDSFNLPISLGNQVLNAYMIICRVALSMGTLSADKYNIKKVSNLNKINKYMPEFSTLVYSSVLFMNSFSSQLLNYQNSSLVPNLASNILAGTAMYFISTNYLEKNSLNRFKYLNSKSLISP